MNRRTIEILVKVIAVLMGLQAVIGIYISSGTLTIEEGRRFPIVFFAAAAILINIVVFFAAVGLWRAITWSWWVGSIWCLSDTFRIIYDAQGSYFIPLGAPAFWLVIQAAALIALFSSYTLTSFGILADRKLVALAVVGGAIGLFSYPYITIGILAYVGT
jgi:hypothetical protein